MISVRTQCLLQWNLKRQKTIQNPFKMEKPKNQLFIMDVIEAKNPETIGC